MGHHHDDEQPNIYDLGLQADLTMWSKAPIERRKILKLGGLGIVALLAGCGTAGSNGGSTANTASSAASVAPTATTAATATSATSASTASASTAATTTTAAASTTTAVKEIPQETAGPYPADGSNASRQNLNALALSGIVRQDIRKSLGSGNTAAGIPAKIELTLVDVNKGNAPLAGYALYIWHCDRAGAYSMYSNGVTNEDYLRGVQVADASGKLTFQSIFPACYQGRWPHIHFEVYPSLDKATSATNAINTSQLALPKAVCDTVYATTGYEQSVKNLSRLSLETDGIFSDGHEWQLATVTGDATNGYTIALTVGVEGAG